MDVAGKPRQNLHVILNLVYLDYVRTPMIFFDTWQSGYAALRCADSISLIPCVMLLSKQ